MRESNTASHAVHQFVICRLRKFKYAEALVNQPMTLDTIAVKHASMGGQTREDSRGRISFGPVQYVRQIGPVRLLPQTRLLWFSSSHDQGIGLAVPESLKVVIETVQTS